MTEIYATFICGVCGEECISELTDADAREKYEMRFKRQFIEAEIMRCCHQCHELLVQERGDDPDKVQ